MEPTHRLLKEFNPAFRDLKVLRDHASPSVKYVLHHHWLTLIKKADNTNAIHSVIAVHGLAADPIKTWVHKDEDCNWLENQLVDLLPEARVWTFGYDSSWCGDSSVDTDLNEVAGKLLDAILAKVLMDLCQTFDCFGIFEADWCRIEPSGNTSYLYCP